MYNVRDILRHARNFRMWKLCGRLITTMVNEFDCNYDYYYR